MHPNQDEVKQSQRDRLDGRHDQLRVCERFSAQQLLAEAFSYIQGSCDMRSDQEQSQRDGMDRRFDQLCVRKKPSVQSLRVVSHSGLCNLFVMQDAFVEQPYTRYCQHKCSSGFK